MTGAGSLSFFILHDLALGIRILAEKFSEAAFLFGKHGYCRMEPSRIVFSCSVFSKKRFVHITQNIKKQFVKNNDFKKNRQNILTDRVI